MIVEEELELSGARVDVERRRTLGEAVGAGLQRFDCVLLDLNLPDAQGLEGLHELRGLAPDLAVLVLTGLDDERRGIEAVGAGAQDYLIKGSTSGVLLARSLRYAVERRRAELTAQQLSIAQLEARENARLERGLLPEPLVDRPGAHARLPLQAGPPPRAARRRLLRRGADAGRDRPRDRRRRQRPRARRGGARRLPPHRLAHARARRRAGRGAARPAPARARGRAPRPAGVRDALHGLPRPGPRARDRAARRASAAAAARRGRRRGARPGPARPAARHPRARGVAGVRGRAPARVVAPALHRRPHGRSRGRRRAAPGGGGAGRRGRRGPPHRRRRPRRARPPRRRSRRGPQRRPARSTTRRSS